MIAQIVLCMFLLEGGYKTMSLRIYHPEPLTRCTVEVKKKLGSGRYFILYCAKQSGEMTQFMITGGNKT